MRYNLILDQSQTIAGHRDSRLLCARNEIAAIAPVVRVGDTAMSPRQTLFNSNRPYTGSSSLLEGEPFAINSGCLMRVEALCSIGGFSQEFWLDYSDMYVFHQFFLHNLRLWRTSDAELQHEMTIMGYDALMASWRYKNFIEAEGAFNDLYKNRFENFIQSLRLVVRSVRQRFRYKDPTFSQITRSHLWTRVRQGRKARLAQQRKAQRKR